MKAIILFILFCIPALAMAQSHDDTAPDQLYLTIGEQVYGLDIPASSSGMLSCCSGKYIELSSLDGSCKRRCFFQGKQDRTTETAALPAGIYVYSVRCGPYQNLMQGKILVLNHPPQ